MIPEICSIGPFTVYSYGLLLACAVIICSYMLSKEAKSIGVNSERVYDFVFFSVLGGILGARIFYIILELDFFLNNPLEIVMIHKGGLAWQGGLILGSISGILFLYITKIPLLQMLDLTAPYLALGQAIGRLGCFFNGCCYGKEAHWGGIYFPVHKAVLIPTQLYAVVGLLVVFLVLKKAQRVVKKTGLIFVLYLGLACVQRFVNQFFRADHNPIVAGLSVFQIVSLCIFIVGVVLYFLHEKCMRK